MKKLLPIVCLLMFSVCLLGNEQVSQGEVPKGSMSARELSEFILAIESFIPEKEAIVEVTLILPIIEVRTAKTFVPLAGRGHILAFRAIDGKWTKTEEREWLS